MLEKSWSEPTMRVQYLHDRLNHVVDTCCIVATWSNFLFFKQLLLSSINSVRLDSMKYDVIVICLQLRRTRDSLLGFQGRASHRNL